MHLSALFPTLSDSFLVQAKQLLEKNEKGHVIATCRDPSGASGLIQLKERFSERLEIQRLDLTDERTIEVILGCFLV